MKVHVPEKSSGRYQAYITGPRGMPIFWRAFVIDQQTSRVRIGRFRFAVGRTSPEMLEQALMRDLDALTENRD